MVVYPQSQSHSVTPAQAGVHGRHPMDARLRGHDKAQKSALIVPLQKTPFGLSRSLPTAAQLHEFSGAECLDPPVKPAGDERKRKPAKGECDKNLVIRRLDRRNQEHRRPAVPSTRPGQPGLGHKPALVATPAHLFVAPAPLSVTPAKAGVHGSHPMDARLRGHDMGKKGDRTLAQQKLPFGLSLSKPFPLSPSTSSGRTEFALSVTPAKAGVHGSQPMDARRRGHDALAVTEISA